MVASFCAKKRISKRFFSWSENMLSIQEGSSLRQNLCGMKQEVIDKITKTNFNIDEEFHEEFSIGSEINSYYLPFYSATQESTILQFTQYVTKIKNSNYNAEEHLAFISLLANVSFSRWLFEYYPEFSDYRLFDWLLYEFLFGSSMDHKRIIVDAIVNYYNYSHYNYNMDLLLLNHFYMQLESFLSFQYKNDGKYFVDEICYLIDFFNKKMFDSYSRCVYYEYCKDMSVFNPLNIIHFIKINSILDDIYISISNKNNIGNIITIIYNSEKLKIKSISNDILFDSYCSLFYHFVLKGQCFVDAVNSLNNNLIEKVYKYKISGSKYVYFVVLPHVTLN